MQHSEGATSGDLAALRKESLRTVSIGAAVVLYIWWLILFQPANLYVDGSLGAAAWTPAPFAAGLIAAFLLQKRHLSLAAAAAILGMAATVVFNMWFLEMTTAAYLLAVVVSLTGVLFGIRTVIGAAALSSLAIIVTGAQRWQYTLFSPTVFVPILVVCAVGALSSMGVHNLYIALSWALDRAKAAQRNEEEARSHRAELARMLKALTEAYQRLEYANYDLARAREVAEEASLNKQRFVAIVSHEMRTPLNVLTALSEIMYFSPERYSDAALPPELRRDVREIYRSSKHLLRLIDDVLDMAQIEAGRMRIEFEPAELGDVVTEILDMIRPFAREKGITLHTTLPEDLPPVLIDRDRIQQVLLNLLNNAQRYTERGSITVRAQHEGDYVTVTVADTGVGIPPHEQEDMFKEFYQVEGLVAKGQGGCGLGLAICRRFIEMHGGRIWLESDGIPGHGSQFHFTLPVVGAKQVKAGKAQRTWIPLQSPTSRGRTLLLLDQDPTIQALLERTLETYQITPVSNVAEIPHLARELHPQAVIINAAREHAGRQAREARQQLDHTPIPVIMCPLVGKKRMGQMLGVLDYLVKPIGRDALLHVIDRVGKPVQRVLVVDDDPQMVRLIARMLETSGRDYEVACAGNGIAGLRDMRARRPDLLLLDIVMPEMDGHAMLAEVRADPALRDIPVVVITAQEHTPEEERLLGHKLFIVRSAAGFTNAESIAYLRNILETATGL